MDDRKNNRPTLSDGEIEKRPSMGRRSLLRRSLGVAGVGAAMSVGLMSTTASAAVTDNDNGSNADPGGNGRGFCRAGTSGVTDRDDGNTADPGGNGRGAQAQQRSGYTDSDGGAVTDPGGSGRGPSRSSSSGMTDADGGNCTDPGGNGRG